MPAAGTPNTKHTPPRRSGLLFLRKPNKTQKQVLTPASALRKFIRTSKNISTRPELKKKRYLGFLTQFDGNRIEIVPKLTRDAHMKHIKSTNVDNRSFVLYF